MADIDDIRTAGNWADWLILIDDPTVIYTARATGAIDQTDWSLDFDGAAGTLGDCLPDMTLLIGSAAGGCDIGIARLRKDPVAGTFYIGADPSLVTADNDYLTVIDDFEPFAKHSIGSALDVDVTYTDELVDFDPIPWFNGRTAVINAGETIGFDATRCWAPDSTISAYAWTFSGATSSTDETTATPTATYETSGRFRVELEVTADNGKSKTGYGYVFVLGDNLEAEADALIDEPESDSAAGAACRVTMLSRPTIRDGARAILISRDWYEGVEVSFGPVEGRENILMEGRILGETIVRDPLSDTVEFEIGGPIRDLAETARLQCGLIDTSFPTDAAANLPAWSKCAGLTAAKGLHFIATQLSTIATCLDFYVEDWEYACPKLSADGSDLYQHLVSFAKTAALSVTADRLGRIFVERDAQLYPVADRDADIPEVMTLADGDWQDQLSIVRRQKGEVSLAEAEGEIFAAGALTKVGGRSPGDTPARKGRSDSLDELYVSTLGDALELAGLLAGAGNQEIEAITVRMAHNNRLMDVAPRQYINVTVDGETLRCIPRNMTMRQDEGTGFKYTELELEPENEEWPAVSINYPGGDDPPVEPPVEPPEPPAPPDEPPEEPDEPSDTDAVVVTGIDVRTCDDLDEASPTWSSEL